MNDVLIEKGVEMPDGGRKSKYPWKKMEVGESFFIERMTISMGAVKDRYSPKEFAMRRMDGGFRIWRIK